MANFCAGILNKLKKLYQTYFYKKLKIAFIGPKNSGKSTMIYSLFDGNFCENVNSVEVRVSKHILGKVDITIYDIPGSEEMRSKWDHYFKKTDVIVFIVDSECTEEELHRAKEDLHSLLYRNMWMKKNVLVLGTKNDLSAARMCKDIILSLDLFSIVDREIACFSVSAKNMSNIDLIKEWIIDQAFFAD
ncbi:ADP-ribosylation factor-like protein 8 [Dictyocoela muelleri]|nr:ADP-ribosylation factor-like protein 8 [Dictyocoela muelleri]